MQWLNWTGRTLVSLYREGQPGLSAAAQLAGILQACDRDLAGAGLALENGVRHRVWTRSRAARDASNDARARLIAGQRRCATSSFIDAGRFISGADVALELLAQVPAARAERRLVDFAPPRRYAHYLVQDGLVFVSGMAESGDGLVQQFERALAEVRRALDLESLQWTNVLSASLFIERGTADAAWLMRRFADALPGPLADVTCEEVDGLASTDKHLEIEVTARR